MYALAFLLRISKCTFLIAALSGVLAGGSAAGLMAIIHYAIQTELRQYRFLLTAFIACWGGYALGSVLSATFLTRLSEQAMYELRLTLSRKIVATPLRTLEEARERLLTVLTADINTIGQVADHLPSTFIGLITILGAYGYLLWISSTLLLGTLFWLALGLVLYIMPTQYVRQSMTLARDELNVLMTHCRALLGGVKELQMHRARRQDFFSGHFQPSCRRLMEQTVRGCTWETLLARWGELFLLIGLGSFLFSLPRHQLTTFDVLANYLFVLGFTLGPLGTLAGFWGQLNRLRIALLQIEAVGVSLEQAQEAPPDVLTTSPFPAVEPPTICLEAVCFTYVQVAAPAHFSLGPLSLTLDCPEIVFLVGGNGSGKSTLGKLLCGLYSPESGQIVYNGVVVESANREAYRQHFAVVFADFFLFEHLLGYSTSEHDSTAQQYLSRLQLDKQVSVRHGHLSTTDLSQGQRRRLALLLAYMDNRPVYLFDEWAADQDPQFKHLFYSELLPELKRRHKMVLVITHDEAYFPYADRLIKLVDGQLVEDTRRCGV